MWSWYIVFSLLVGLGIATEEKSLGKGGSGFLDVIGSAFFWPAFMGTWLARSFYSIEGKKKNAE
ncbi:MAG: hypothetical protein AAB375_02405 [Patescibacteria group bacterium]